MKDQGMTGAAREKVLAGTIGVLVIALIFAGYEYYTLSTELATVKSALIEATSSLAEQTDRSTNLLASLTAEQERNNEFANQIGSISSTVGKLDKLQNTDPQLLAKYSKVYFLSDTYIPKNLTVLASSTGFEKNRTYQVVADVEPHLMDMINAAENDGITLKVASAYRSFGDQAGLKSSYSVTYGKGANAFSADQGYSEHQLGTTLDFTTPTIGGGFVGFDKSDAFAWLNKNAWKYGFILSYPQGNGYYVFEPWHWRFVGLTLADELNAEKKYFYQLDQRTINQYLIDFPN